MSALDRKIVVISPIKNEEWILDYFLKATSVYADHIVISDHSSTDSSVEIAKKYPKVKLITSTHTKYAEAERRNELLEAARDFGQGNLILAIDADEFLSPSVFSEQSKAQLLSLAIGTRLQIPLWNVRPNFKQYWNPGMTPVGFIDDGSMHSTENMIHFPRIPQLKNQNLITLEDEALLHLQFIQWDRMESKHRWYKAWETLNFPQKSPVEIFRRYDHMNILPKSQFKLFRQDWLESLKNDGVDLRDLTNAEKKFWWDAEVLNLIELHGAEVFRYLNLSELGVTSSTHKTAKNLTQVAFFKFYLWATSPLHKLSHFWPIRLGLRVLDKASAPLFR